MKKQNTPAAAALATALAAALLWPALTQAAPGTFTVFDDIPQFGMYVSTAPNYTPPAGTVMQDNGITFLTKLTPEQKAMIGADVKARVVYHAQCDNYDRLGSLFMVVKPIGAPLTGSETRIELLRWVTPFSDYWQGKYATHVYPPASLAPFQGALVDGKHDVWIGVTGGSNPYDGDPCDGRVTDPDFAAVGFRYSVSLSSTQPARKQAAGVLAPVTMGAYNAVPVTGSADSTIKGVGIAVVIVSGHGSASGGDEYKHTEDTLSFNGEQVGNFSTQVNCASYRKYSPDGNPFLFLNNNGSNPRNWCPGALVETRTFPVSVLKKNNSVSLDMDDPAVPEGSYYQTSISIVAK